MDRRDSLLCLGIAALALIVRLIYVASLSSGDVVGSIDAAGYDRLARNLLAGRGFSLCKVPPYYPTNIRTPLYPAFVAVVYALAGERPEAVAAAQALLDSGTTLLVGTFVGRLTNRRVGLVAAALYALTPGQVQYSGALMTETLLAFLIALTVWVWTGLIAKRQLWMALICGLVCGLCALCKPNALALGAIVAAATWIALRRSMPGRALMLAACALSTCALTLLPWMMRNRIIFGRWYVANTLQGNLIRVTAPVTLAWVRGVPAIPWSPPVEAIYNELVAQTAARHGWTPGLWCEIPPAEFERRERQVAAVAWDAIRLHLDAAWHTHWIGFMRGWAPEGFVYWYHRLGFGEWAATGVPGGGYANAIEYAVYGRWHEAMQAAVVEPWQMLPPAARVMWFGWGAAYLVGGVLALLGAWRLHRCPAALFLLAATILYTVFLPGPISSLRFRVPVVPLIVALVAIGMTRPQSSFRCETRGGFLQSTPQRS